ncbi:hypothetical protein ACOMHN_057424 [Nucella lapillus]
MEREKLLQSLQKKRPNSELVMQTGFGQVRLDDKTKKSLQEVETEQFLRTVSQTASNESVIQKMMQPQTSELRGKQTQKGNNSHKRGKQRHPDSENKESDEYSVSRKAAVNYIDEQYFGIGSASETFLSAVDGTAVSDLPRPTWPLEEHQSIAASTQDTASTISPHGMNSHSTPVKDLQDQAHNIIEEAYFPTSTTDLPTSSDTLESNSRRESDWKQNDQHSTTHSFIDDQYFSPQLSSRDLSEAIQLGKHGNQMKTVETSDERLNEISQDFDGGECAVENGLEASEDLAKTAPQVRATPEQPKGEFTFIDEQYFESQSDVPLSSLENTAQQYGISGEEAPPKFTALCDKTENLTGTSVDVEQTGDNIRDRSPEVFSPCHRRKVTTSDSDVREVEDSAYQAALKLRRNIRLNLKSTGEEEAKAEGGRRDSRVQVLKDQVPDLGRMPAVEVAQLLADSILFENDDFIAVNKPYGLPSHGGPGVRVSVGQVLGALCGRVDRGRGQLDSLHLVHRLDKETTGIMLLAKNAEVAWQLLGMFRRREVGKTYWTVTKGLPQPHEELSVTGRFCDFCVSGVIDIPLARQKVNGIYKTVVMPKEYVSENKVRARTWNRSSDKSMAAVTEYRVLAHRDSMALVECRPLTGIQHQIRAHLAQALNAPVLGDHKYSHMDKLAPQRLFPEALQKLGVRQAQVRHLPMHLHAKGLVLPQWRGRSNFFIAAPVPKFFLRNLKALKIRIPPR